MKARVSLRLAIGAATLLLAGCAGEGALPGIGVSTEPPASSAGASIAGASVTASAGATATGAIGATLGAASPAAAPAFNPFADPGGTPPPAREVIANPTMAEVMQTGALPERALGRADAPVTFVKYASMTCPYCRKFQADVFPKLKRAYIDTGKVRYILREFPIGKQSGLATIALRCAPADRHFALYDRLMAEQPAWVSQEVRPDPIFKVAAKVGMTRAQFDACRADPKLTADLGWVKERGRTLGIIGTPNFFLNGRLIKTALDWPTLVQLLDAELAGKGAVAGPVPTR